MNDKVKIAVHKFSSCDGCQLSLLNMGDALFQLLSRIEILHFAEMGVVDEQAAVDISFIEGSVSTQKEIGRLKNIREQSKLIVTIGACATSGGIQSLRNDDDGRQWLADIYTDTSMMDFEAHSKPISDFVYVDYQLWGCPINPRLFVNLLNDLLLKVRPRKLDEKLCLECKRRQLVCTLVSSGQCCMGPITRGGCDALCPAQESGCYGCFGPAENINVGAMHKEFVALGMNEAEARNRIRFIHSQNPAFDAIKA